jgi:DNA-directed RNA polymerase subunit N (RpoN/RPB10)
MTGESTLNEYNAYKNLVKHKKRINCVFSELGAETSFFSRRPGVDKKAPASCSG